MLHLAECVHRALPHLLQFVLSSLGPKVEGWKGWHRFHSSSAEEDHPKLYSVVEGQLLLLEKQVYSQVPGTGCVQAGSVVVEDLICW